MTISDSVEFDAMTAAGASICASNALGRLVEAWRGLGYQLTNGYAWPPDEPGNLITTPQAIAEKVAHACNMSEVRRGLNLWRPQFDFRYYTLDLNAAGRSRWSVTCLLETLLGAQNDQGAVNAARFIEVLVAAFESVPTRYACSYVLQDAPTVEQVLNGQVDRIYPVNYFGPEYLAPMDAARLRATPAEIVREVAGGILIVPAIETLWGNNVPALRAAQRHIFGNDEVGVSDDWLEESL